VCYRVSCLCSVPNGSSRAWFDRIGRCHFCGCKDVSFDRFPVESERIVDSGGLREVKEIEIGQLQLRYAHTRMSGPRGSRL